VDAERKDAGGASPEDIEGYADDDYVLALVLRLCELDPLAEPGELEFIADDSRVLLGAVQAGGPIHPELEPRLERVQRQRQLVEHFSLARLRRELDRKRLELRRRALQQRQVLLHQQMREAVAAERLQLAPTLTEVAREISHIDDALQQFDTRGVRDGAASA
jgi:hypothetical protein